MKEPLACKAFARVDAVGAPRAKELDMFDKGKSIDEWPTGPTDVGDVDNDMNGVLVITVVFGWRCLRVRPFPGLD